MWKRLNDKLDFTPVGKDTGAANRSVRPSVTFWGDAWCRLRANRVAMVSLTFVVIVVLFGIIGSYFFTDYTKQDLLNTLQSPGQDNILGTDELGRDLLARLIRGTKVSLDI